jgi:hypothetical protein
VSSDETQAQGLGEDREVRAKLRGIVFVGARGGVGGEEKKHAVLARRASKCKEIEMHAGFGACWRESARA